MKKSFIEGLEKQRKNKMSSKTIIMLYRKQIYEALDAGFSGLDIYNYMVSENMYPYSYSAFIRSIKACNLNESVNLSSESNKPSDGKILAAKKDEPLKFNPKADISKLI